MAGIGPRGSAAAIDRSGRGRASASHRRAAGWPEHHDDLWRGTERAFAANCRAQLVDAWLPALDGVASEARERGPGRRRGCGHGASTILMAEAYPPSSFVGVDYHADSIETACARARQAGVGGRVRFEIGATRELRRRGLRADGVHRCPARPRRSRRAPPATPGARSRRAARCLVVEPFANDRIEDNLNPAGRRFYGISTLVCTPGALSQPGSAALGTQAGEARLRGVLPAERLRLRPPRRGDAVQPRPRGKALNRRDRPVPPARARRAGTTPSRS